MYSIQGNDDQNNRCPNVQIFGSNYIIQDIKLSKNIDILVCVTRLLFVQTNKGGVS